MGLYTGSASYVRYKVEGELHGSLKETGLLRLKECSFRELDELSGRDRTIGWVSVENMASVFFDDLHFAKDPYIAVSLRIDTRRIPPLTLKAALLREEMSYKKHTNKERLSRKEKDTLKEQVKNRLLKKALPVPVLYDVCWNTATGILLFFSTNKKANAEFMDFFLSTFELTLTPLFPYELAQMVGAGKKGKIRLEKTVSPFADNSWSKIKAIM
ncbi:MAG: recombination-associated protein RdgC [Proteobacteria bacterium]|nr:recombination-associated protein RdgC [Pseudomonadota bacterium]